MDSMNRRSRRRLLRLACIAASIVLTALFSTQNASADTSKCAQLQNGTLCLYVTTVGEPSGGYLRVSYQKRSGQPVYGHLRWTNLTNGRYYESSDVWMYAGTTYTATWPSYIAPGCNRGAILDRTHGEFTSTPDVCV